MRPPFVLLLLIAALPGKAFAGHEIEGSFKGDETHPSALPVRGETSAGFASKYVFRGTDLAPHSDGLIWGEGTISVSPWDNGTFSLGFWAGSQVGTARFSTTLPAFRRSSEATDFTARDQNILSPWFGRGTPAGPLFLETREADKDFFGHLFNDTFTVRRGLELGDLFAYLKRAYARLGTEQGHRYPLFRDFRFNPDTNKFEPVSGFKLRPPVFPFDPVTGERSEFTDLNQSVFHTAPELGFSNDIEGYLRASGYRGPFPEKITQLERDLKVTQQEFHELRIPFSYDHELGPLSVSIANVFYYAEQELTYREHFRERFASDEARRLIDFASRSDIYVSPGVISPREFSFAQLLAPMLPIRPGHPEDLLSNYPKTRVRHVTTRETYDRIDLTLGTNSSWLLQHGERWPRYLGGQITYSHTLFSDSDTGGILPGYSSAEHGSYLAFELDGHVPLLPERSSGNLNARMHPQRTLRASDKLSLDVAALVSASFGDRSEGTGEPVRGWHDFEIKAEVNWWMTPCCRLAPSINYYTLISEPVSGTERNVFWYGLTCEMCF
jgi:hypothetical protein